MSDTKQTPVGLRAWRQALRTPEGRIFATGVGVVVLYLVGIGVLWPWRADTSQRLLGMTTTHVIGGRAAGISTGIEVGLPIWLVIVGNVIIESFIVLLIYPLFVLSYRKLIVIGPLKESLDRTQRYAEAHQAKIMRWGVPGLLLFVWFPFWMTGPVVGSIIGFLIGLRPWVTMAVVLSGTSLAIVCWVYVLHQMFSELRSLGPYVPFVFVALIILVAVSIHIRQAIGRRANGSQQPDERDQD